MRSIRSARTPAENGRRGLEEKVNAVLGIHRAGERDDRYAVVSRPVDRFELVRTRPHDDTRSGSTPPRSMARRRYVSFGATTSPRRCGTDARSMAWSSRCWMPPRLPPCASSSSGHHRAGRTRTWCRRTHHQRDDEERVGRVGRVQHRDATAKLQPQRHHPGGDDRGDRFGHLSDDARHLRQRRITVDRDVVQVLSTRASGARAHNAYRDARRRQIARLAPHAAGRRDGEVLHAKEHAAPTTGYPSASGDAPSHA